MKTKQNQSKVKPLDPREAARKFMAEARHDWRAGLHEVVRLALSKRGAA